MVGHWGTEPIQVLLALMRWHYGHIEALQNPSSLIQRSNNDKASQDVIFVLVVLADVPVTQLWFCGKSLQAS